MKDEKDIEQLGLDLALMALSVTAPILHSQLKQYHLDRIKSLRQSLAHQSKSKKQSKIGHNNPPEQYRTVSQNSVNTLREAQHLIDEILGSIGLGAAANVTKVIQALHSAKKEDVEKEADEVVSALKGLNDWLSNAPPVFDKLILPILISIIATVIIAITEVMISNDSSDQKIDAILEQLSEMQAFAETRLYEVKTVSAPIRFEPSKSGKILGRLHKNDLVRHIERRGSWVLISYANEEGQIAPGWVCYKHLKISRR